MLKKVVFVLLSVACGVFAEWTGLMDKPATRLVDGEEYYVIQNAEHLAWFANEVNLGSTSLKLILDTNIVFGENAYTMCTKNWTPIGNGSAFSGVIDGNGYTIFGLNGSGSNVGLVGTLSGTIKNLTISYSSFTASGTNGFAGAFAGTNNGTVSYKGSSGQYNYIGGIVGDNSGNVVGSKNTGAITGIYAGGIVGYATAGSTQKCTNTGSVSGYDVGGIVGYVKNGMSIANCVNNGNVTGQSYGRSGGLAGYTTGSTSLSFSTSSSITVGYSGMKGALYGTLYGASSYTYYDSRVGLGAYGEKNQSGTTSNVSDMTTANMQKDLFAWNLNTKFGTASNSGIWCRTSGYPQIADGNCKATKRVIFDNNGQTTTVYTNSKGNVTLPEAPDAGDDQVFMGRYDGETLITGETIVLNDMTAKAVFANKEDLYYSVRFYNSDLTLIDSLYLQYETIPEWNGSVNRESTAQYTYEFTGWDKELAPVTCDADYYAVYDSSVRKYEVVFADYDGTVLGKDSVPYGEMPLAVQDPERASTKKYSYAFKSWSPEIAAVLKNVQYKALYDSVQFNCSIRIDMGDFSMESSIGCGNAFTLPTVPKKDGFTFEGWYNGEEKLGIAGDEIEVSDDMTITAKYSEIPDDRTVLALRKAASHLFVAVDSRHLQIRHAPIGVNYALFDMQGRSLLQGKTVRSEFRIAVKPGHYLLRVGSEMRHVMVK